MKWLRELGLLVLLAAGFGACTKSPSAATPEAAIENYVKIAFGARDVADGKKLLELSTGEAREWLASMSEDAFKKQFLENHMVLQSFSTKDVRHEANGDVSLVYEIAFKDGAADGKPTSQAVFTNKKIAYLTKEDNAWKIKATKNVKTFIERKDALEIPPNFAAETEAGEGKSEPHGK
jgi:hypothetical protein